MNVRDLKRDEIEAAIDAPTPTPQQLHILGMVTHADAIAPWAIRLQARAIRKLQQLGYTFEEAGRL